MPHYSDPLEGAVERGGHAGLSEAITHRLLAREMNEQLYRSSFPEGAAPAAATIAALCECERRSCAKRLTMTVTEYDGIRRFPTRFALAPAHASAVGERVVDVNDGFVVVEHTGPQARAAIYLDPRRRPRVRPVA